MTFIDYPAAACIARINVPAYSTPRPNLADAGLTPPDILATLSQTWLRQAQPAREVVVYRLQNTVITSDGTLRDTDGRIYRPSLAGRAPDSVADLPDPHDLPRLNATCLLCKPPSLHRDLTTWLLNALPAAWLTRHRIPPAEDLTSAIVIIDDAADPLRQAMVDSLQLLSPPMPVATFLPAMHLQVSELIVCDGLDEPSPLAIEALHALTAAIPAGPPQLLFFSTTHSPAPQFRPSAEADAIARAAGWTVIHPARRNFRELVALCKGALAIAGIAGPDLAYAAFARRGTTVVNFAPATLADTTLWHLAALRNHRYTENRCAQHTDQPDCPPPSRDLAMPLATLNTHLRQIAANVCA